VPSNTPFFFYLAAGVWITLGWQAHAVLSLTSLSGIFPVLVIVAISVLVIRKIAPILKEDRWIRLLRKETGVLLLLLGGILFWPQQAFLTTISVEIALLAALFLIILLRVSIKTLFELIGVQFSWTTENK
jgi:predicted MPP superfamily phosphohydrolase